MISNSKCDVDVIKFIYRMTKMTKATMTKMTKATMTNVAIMRVKMVTSEHLAR